MKEPIKCPACGIENPRNRLTCEVCGERLIPNPKKLNPPEKSEKPEKIPRKKKDIPSENIKSESADTSSTKMISPTPSEVESPPPIIKQRKSRKKRAKTVKESDPVFFILRGGKLQPVHITWGVMKPLKRKELSMTERNVLSIWNRTKDLIRNN